MKSIQPQRVGFQLQQQVVCLSKEVPYRQLKRTFSTAITKSSRTQIISLQKELISTIQDLLKILAISLIWVATSMKLLPPNSNPTISLTATTEGQTRKRRDIRMHRTSRMIIIWLSWRPMTNQVSACTWKSYPWEIQVVKYSPQMAVMKPLTLIKQLLIHNSIEIGSKRKEHLLTYSIPRVMDRFPWGISYRRVKVKQKLLK